MTVQLTKSDARKLLANYHFEPRSQKEAFEFLGSVQYDPLKPIGRNHDLVLQARVSDYKIDDWQNLAYSERFIYDAWDKQASLVLMSDWPKRKIYHKWHKKTWQKRVLNDYPKAVKKVLAELSERGPLASNDFDFQIHKKSWEGSWYGPKVTKNILRALWHTGVVATSHRHKARHVYDLAENVISKKYFESANISDTKALEWLILSRHKAMGLLRPNANKELWSMQISSKERLELIAKLVKKGKLIRIEIDGVLFHACPDFLESKITKLDKMIFIAPLDQFVWDRQALKEIFEFEYVWEVYKPEKLRKWGYYVLPVLYNDKLVARFDSRYKDGVWQLYRWYWEDVNMIDAKMLTSLSRAVAEFKRYLGATKIKLNKGMDIKTRQAWQLGDKL